MNYELEDWSLATLIPSEKLGEGWFWRSYGDGSGNLVSPDGKEYMEYDLATNEYKMFPGSGWDVFPLSSYFIDGVEPFGFDPFEYMEEEMMEYLALMEKDCQI